MLGVSPNTLRSWERRYGWPQPERSPGNHRQFSLTQIDALKQTLTETHNVSSAISLARSRGEGPSTAARLIAAFGAFDEDRVDRLLEESLALRSVERTVEEVLLPAVTAHLAPSAASAPEYEFAWRHATGWLSALKRLAPPASRNQAVLVFDATVPCELDALYAQALEVIMRRAGLRTLSLTPAIDPARLGRALRALAPNAVVLTGRRASLETIGKLVYAVRGVTQAALICDYRGAVPDTGASTVCRLGDAIIAARDELITGLDAPARASASTGALQPAAARSA
jgi:MerR family transcriptional regulator, light-induced transcriptional regulator